MLGLAGLVAGAVKGYEAAGLPGAVVGGLVGCVVGQVVEYGIVTAVNRLCN